jgi:hypothetical protein
LALGAHGAGRRRHAGVRGPRQMGASPSVVGDSPVASAWLDTYGIDARERLAAGDTEDEIAAAWVAVDLLRREDQVDPARGTRVKNCDNYRARILLHAGQSRRVPITSRIRS